MAGNGVWHIYIYNIYIYIHYKSLGIFFKVPKIKVQIGALDFHDYKFSQLIIQWRESLPSLQTFPFIGHNSLARLWRGIMDRVSVAIWFIGSVSRALVWCQPCFRNSNNSILDLYNWLQLDFYGFLLFIYRHPLIPTFFATKQVFCSSFWISCEIQPGGDPDLNDSMELKGWNQLHHFDISSAQFVFVTNIFVLSTLDNVISLILWDVSETT